jgi:signal transduction histidine kinase
VNDTLQLFVRELERDNIKIVIQLPDQFIYADRNLTQQVLINLIKNAAESMNNMKENKRIEIGGSRESNRYVHLHVHDTGAGILPENMDQIFIPFFSTKKSGSGIGLSISKQIMQKQKGDISVQSEPGKGSIFTLSFVGLK